MDEIQVGTFVEWPSSGGTARGRVIQIETAGEVEASSGFTMEGSEDDPALLIALYEARGDGFVETDTTVVHRASTVTAIEPLSAPTDADADADANDDSARAAETADAATRQAADAPRKAERFSVPPMATMARFHVANAEGEADDRTIEVVWSTGAAVRRYDVFGLGEFEEVLDMDGVDLSRMNDAPFLSAHNAFDLDAVLGVVESAGVEQRDGQTVGVASVRFADTHDVDTVYQKIRQGVIRQVSVGYEIHEAELVERDDDVPQVIVRRWTPYEISAVPVGADASAKFAARSNSNKGVEAILHRPVRADESASDEGGEDVSVVDPNRVIEIRNICARAGQSARADEFIQAGLDTDTIKQRLFDAMVEREPEIDSRIPANNKTNNGDNMRQKRSRWLDAAAGRNKK